jgi:hypothetical protein
MAAAAAQAGNLCGTEGVYVRIMMIVMTYIKLKKTVGTSTLGRLATNGHASGSFISP